MDFEFDPVKNAKNQEKHGLRCEDVSALSWSTALFRVDTRKDYGEERVNAFLMGPDGKIYNVVFTERSWHMRFISFRRAGLYERIYYEQTDR